MKLKKALALVMSLVLIGGAFAACSKTENTSKGSDASGAASTDNSLQAIKDKGELVMGLDDSFPPMGFRDDKNNIVGFDIDVATEVCKRMGVTLKPQPIKWSSNVLELDTKQVDCLWNGFTIRESLKSSISYSVPYLKNRQVFVVRKDSGITKKDDLAGKVLALQAGSSASEALDGAAEFKKSLKKTAEFDDNVTALMDLEKKSCDAVLVDEIVAQYYITSNKKDNFTVLSEDLAKEEYGIGFRKADKTLTDEVNKQLKAMAQDGKLKEISVKWFGSDITVVEK